MENSVCIDAHCRAGGYKLFGLSEPICPECGRAFDPRDATTYVLDPVVRRRRRRVMRTAAFVLVAIALFFFAPRRLLRLSVTFTCTVCGESSTVKRFEPCPASWLMIRYPGFSTRTGPVFPSGSSPSAAACKTHAYLVSVRADFPAGSCTGTATATAAEVVLVNGQITTPQTAENVLKDLSAPSNAGISIGPLAKQPAKAIP